MTRINRVRAKLKKDRLDGLVLSSQPNISYLTGFTSRESYLLITQDSCIFFTDSRYAQEAKIGLRGIATVQKTAGHVLHAIATAFKKLGLRRIGFEERHLSYAQFKRITQATGKSTELVPVYGFTEELRLIKNAGELAKIREAVRITIEAFSFIRDFIRPGQKELEVAAEIERHIRYNQARSSAFEIIVASGPNSSFPHHIPSSRPLKNNEPVLIDIGVDYMGYKSDLTRVYFLGKISALNRRIYDIVLRAQERAIKHIRPGAFINKVDSAARQYIAENGYGGFFNHSLGHGIGLEVHELLGISAGETAPLKEGMLFTVEPAIYLPRKFGIRIEDMVLVTKKGCEVISGALDK
jgi:Xaa-Pro aminopeptidase